MAAPQNTADDDLLPTQTEGYKVGDKKTIAELSNLDSQDESLQRWKQSLGIGAAGSGVPAKVIPKTLFLSSPTLPKPIVLDLTLPPAELAKMKKDNPVTIKEGVEYSVGITFAVEGEIVSGLKFIQVVKRAGVKVDSTEEMLGSYGPQEAVYTKIFPSDESPSGMLARSGSYNVKSRVIDDDKHVWLDFEWGFKLAKDW